MRLSSNNGDIVRLLKLLFLRNKALILALIVSFLLHVFLLSKFLFILPQLDEERQAIEVRLVKLLPAQKTTVVAPINDTSQMSLETSKILQHEPKLSIANDISTPTDKAKVQQKKSDETALISTPQNTQPIDQVANNDSFKETLMSSETRKINESTELVNVTNKPTPQAYQYVETEFEVLDGNDGSVVGITRIVYKLDKNGTYQLTSVTEAKDLTPLTFGELIQKSEGVVTDKGLTPSYYSYEDRKNPSKMQSSRFSWSEGILLMHSAKSKNTEDLVSSTQDPLSFMYQFMFSPPSENMQITMTNGEYLSTYTYIFLGEVKISTKLGELNTIHLLKSDDEKEQTELWLGIDYQYLPVKIRKTKKDGSLIEQTATSIYTALP
ncbi:DUF3108 domain-containing protein [Methylotenera sp.]|uniref:DUF3108 domain-containing protein n=1 Tax=Methylotenera sp. TaxID=2051956 RepID=UPI0027211C2B|nr:DUF3108 domain-containing protein [Methylotenera sp.]MDO9205440.1 DUF3108 domain-containing protein [Methylotenera sp.]MDP3006145.1 DUF3108 domain-containing protein [Methylotenera sp.]